MVLRKIIIEHVALYEASSVCSGKKHALHCTKFVFFVSTKGKNKTDKHKTLNKTHILKNTLYKNGDVKLVRDKN